MENIISILEKKNELINTLNKTDKYTYKNPVGL